MPQPANKKLFNSQVIHSIGLKRLETSNARKIGKFLERTENKIFEDILQLETKALTQPVSATARKFHLRNLRRLQRDMAQNDIKVFRRIREQMTEIGNYEYGFSKRLTKQSFPFPVQTANASQSVLYSATFSRPFEGELLKNWASGLSSRKLDRATRALNLAFYNGEGVSGATRRLIGTRGFPGVLKVNRREAEALARTGLNHAVNQAKDVFHRKNPVGTKYRYTAIIDGRTTIICASRDGRLFKRGDRPLLPAHVNCRSTYVAIADPNVILGDRSTVTDTRTRKKIRRGWEQDAKRKAGTKWKTYDATKRKALVKAERQKWIDANIGTVPAKTNFSQWLKGQSAEFQNNYLGKSRSALFRRGKLPLEKFLDKQTGKPINLTALRKAEPSAFKLAGL